MIDISQIVIGILIGVALGSYLSSRLDRKTESSSEDGTPSGQIPGHHPEKDHRTHKLFGISTNLLPLFEQSSTPSDFLRDPSFTEGVSILATDVFQPSDLINFYNGKNLILACMAVEALAQRTDELDDLSGVLLKTVNSMHEWTRWFVLRTLSVRCSPPLIGRVLKTLDESWADRSDHLFLREFIQRQIETGEPLELGPAGEDLSENRVEFLSGLFEKIGPDVTGGLITALHSRQELFVDKEFLSSVGRIWDSNMPDEKIFENEELRRLTDRVLRRLKSDPRRSVLIVGPVGVGKSTLIRRAATYLQQEGWTIFEASAADVQAGQMFIGMQEEHVKRILRNLGGGRRILWIIPRFHEMMWAGRHLHSPVSILDMILPFLENGSILVAGEIEPEACDQVLRRIPRLNVVLDLIRVDPLPTVPTLQLARKVTKHLGVNGGYPIPDPVVSEALKLSDQYLGRDSSPGGVLDLFKRTIEMKSASDSADELLSSRDLQQALSGLTGLPSVILDEHEPLDIDALRDFFESRILGQPEAIQCLVDRVAMIKAGLTDPTRPLGVFLFAGPTGTGKTELAKALAGFLFGSADRMLRLDMGEFQTSDSLSRILGDTRHDFDQEALADRIRNQPFAVVLLDEFEKAHERIWDVFLQLFDDGRLTDRHGNTADFRHAIVIMTTNLGSHDSRSIGFIPQPEQTIRPALENAFKKEFLNRIDQIVVFRALTRAVMRDILMKELNEALGRRGLRTRQWAVEWEPSAIDFLLSKGFTEDLGARPLKRSIERHVLSPLAATIVDHQYPEGDQFLFVRSGGESIEVAFVDPDEPGDYADVEVGQPVTDAEPPGVRDIVLSPRGVPKELDLLRHQYEQLVQKVEDETWTGKKNSFIESMNDPGFWDSKERYEILGTAEYMDRIEEGLRTAGSLLERLSGKKGETRDKFSVSLIRRIAQRIYLVEAACRGLDEGEPSDAFILIETIGRRTNLTEVSFFAEKLQSMYQQWAKHREMQCISLAPDSEKTGDHFHTIMAVSGFAAFQILKPEHGIHEMAITGKKGQTVHLRTRVLVSPQPEEPIHGKKESLLRQAGAFFSLVETDNLKVVRRYREEPSPLVRDSVRQFRTGRIDVIWRGDFDLL